MWLSRTGLPEVAAPGSDMASAGEAAKPGGAGLDIHQMLLVSVLAWVDQICNANPCKHASLLFIPGVAVEVESAAGCKCHRCDGSGEGVPSAVALKKGCALPC